MLIIHNPRQSMLLGLLLGATLAANATESETPIESRVFPGVVLGNCGADQLDFANQRAIIVAADGTLASSARLRKGYFESKWTTENGATSTKLIGVRYLPGSDGRDRAVVSYWWGWVGGSSSQSFVVQVFQCADGRLVLNQQIESDGHGLVAGVTFRQKGKVLTMKGVRYGNGAHCCPEYLDIARYEWSGEVFVQREYKTIPMPPVGVLADSNAVWFKERVTWEAGLDPHPWETAVASPDGKERYRLALVPLWAVEGGIVAIEILVARPERPKDNLLGERKSHVPQRFVVTVEELERGINKSRFGAIRVFRVGRVKLRAEIKGSRLGRGVGECPSCWNIQELSAQLSFGRP